MAKKVQPIILMDMTPLYDVLGIEGREGETLEVEMVAAWIYDYIDKKVDEKCEPLEARIKEIEVFMNDVVRPAHREPETEPKIEEHVQKPRSSNMRDEDTETRENVLRMEHAARLARRR